MQWLTLLVEIGMMITGGIQEDSFVGKIIAQHRNPPLILIWSFYVSCQSDFGLDTQPTKGDFVNLARAVDGSESGVFVLDQFKGSGKNWEFRINEVCAEDLCSSASRILIGVLPLLLVGGMTMFLHILS
mmetsp:Transcript_35770/g.42099  ORF Transcript_35770/g.42099 Transcript_35770/m.42099 type:complete len:129 (+) Transcript_35770:282-668(+)